MTTVLIIIGVLILFSLGIFAFLRWKDKQREEKPSEPVSNQEPTTEPEKPVKPVKPKFHEGDWVVQGCNILNIRCVGDEYYCYETVGGYVDDMLVSEIDSLYHLWTIQDAKDGDVLVDKVDDMPFIYKAYKNKAINAYCGLDAFGKFKLSDLTAAGWLDMDGALPAAEEQKCLLFEKMAEAGYTWDADTNTLSKIEEVQEPEQPSEPKTCMYANDNYTEDDRESLCEGCEEECEYKPKDADREFKYLINYFASVIKVEEGSKTYNYLKERFDEAEAQFLDSELYLGEPDLMKEELFPSLYNYHEGLMKEKNHPFERLSAWLFGLILAEIDAEYSEEIIWMAYDYPSKGKDMPTYGYSWDDDPNDMRMIAAALYASTRDASNIPELRKEVGGKMLTYKNDISECYIDCTKFMPTAPFPFLEGYTYRPKGLPVDATPTADMDEEIHNYISQYYSLDTKDKEKRQRTIQAIADKEYKKPHLFGKPRTVKDDKYGEMSFCPVFGEHNIGIEIPDNGVIAEMCYTLGKPCSYTRESLLNQEYGRRRPGEGETDGKANTDPKQRVLVNYSIEEGDGRTTGYYNKNGQYVDSNGNYIGDYETYFQNQVYANSYPSGHSAFIEGVGLILMMIMPERADKILKAINEYTNSRMICRFHWQSDTIHGRVIGTMMVPVLAATTNVDFDNLLNKAKEEYQRILSGDVTPEPTPTEKVNTSLAYFIGGYGSCHVDAGEKEMIHCCTKQCTKERHPAIQVNQRVNFTLEGCITTDAGKTSGVWEANKAYGIKCPAVKEDKIATITMWNDGGKRVLEYRLSKDGTHDDGAIEY